MRDKPYAAIPLIDEAKVTIWYATATDAEFDIGGVDYAGKPVSKDPSEGYSIQYRPGRKPKVKK